MATETVRGYKKPEETDTFMSYITNQNANIDLLEQELEAMTAALAAKADVSAVAAKQDACPAIVTLDSAAELTLTPDTVTLTTPLSSAVKVTIGAVEGEGVHTLVWYITMPSAKYSITWDSRIHWINNMTPNYSFGTRFEFNFTTYDGGETWLGTVLQYV